MKKTAILLLTLLIIILISSCRDKVNFSNEPETGLTKTGGVETFSPDSVIVSLKYRETKSVVDDIHAEFFSVSDYRCTDTANCDEPGNAQVTIILSGSDVNTQNINMNTDRAPNSFYYSTYRIKLLKLEPVPAGISDIEKGDYVATLLFIKTNA